MPCQMQVYEVKVHLCCLLAVSMSISFGYINDGYKLTVLFAGCGFCSRKYVAIKYEHTHALECAHEYEHVYGYQ